MEKCFLKLCKAGPAIFIVLFLFACFGSTALRAEEPLEVFVSIVPQKYFIEKIAGDLVEISVMVLPGSNPASYEPRPRQMAALATASLYFAVDVPFEKTWLNRFSKANPKMTIVDTYHGIIKIPMAPKHSHTGHDHHGITDPHIWLSPPLVKIQAKNILSGLQKADPEHKSVYADNYRSFLQEIEALDQSIHSVFSEKNHPKIYFMVYHPSWGYFAQAYGLTQIPIEMEGKEPSAKELVRYMKQARQMGIKAIFVQPQFSQKSAQTIADAIGCRLLVADPMAENWAENLLKVAMAFKAAFTETR